DYMDNNLKNPWGIAFAPDGPFWVANNHSGTSTLYDTSGKPTGKVVTIASSSGPSGGEPTGIVYNSTQYFKIPNIGPSLYIYAGEDGTILAWGASSNEAVMVASHEGAVYKGLAIGMVGNV